MARVTVEDCRWTVPNPFELVLLAAERARSLRVGAAPLVEPGRDATSVVALREIAAGLASPPHLRDLALRRRFVLSVPPTGNDDVPARSVLFPDEEPELRYEADGDGFDDVEDEDVDDEAALARLVEEEMRKAR